MRKILTVICTVLASAILISCETILENRSKCKCILKLDVSHILGVSTPAELAGCPLTAIAYDAVTRHRIAQANTTLTDTIKVIELFVPRSCSVIVTAIFTGRKSKGTVINDILMLPSGEQGDSLYAFHREGLEIGHKTDELTIPVTMHKQFTTVTVNGIVGKPSEELTLYAFSGVSALDLRTFAVAEGVFRCSAEPDTVSSRARWTLRLPRQSGDSLYMNVSDATSGGGDVMLFDLAATLVKAGYDFDAEDLADISLDLDLKAGTAVTGYGEWGDTVKVDKSM